MDEISPTDKVTLNWLLPIMFSTNITDYSKTDQTILRATVMYMHNTYGPKVLNKYIEEHFKF
jgi:hypothetical protein